MGVFKVVLTGGPCAGKTTAISKIEQELTDRGYQAIIVDETATTVISGGVKPFGENGLTSELFQELILKFQDSKEKIFEEVAKLYNKPVVIVFDRGMIDGGAYYDKFDELLTKNKYSREKLYSRYDLVVHLVSAAIGAPEHYSCENNPSRYESTIELATEADMKTLQSWVGHSNLCIIDNSTSFNAKVSRVVDKILENLDISTDGDSRYVIEFEENPLIRIPHRKIEINQYYLKHLGDIERRIRERIIDGYSALYYCEKAIDENGIANLKKERKIHEREFEELKLEAEKYVHKYRYCFVVNNICYKLDEFDDGMKILEVQSKNPSLEFLNLSSILDVSKDGNYRNINLATWI